MRVIEDELRSVGPGAVEFTGEMMQRLLSTLEAHAGEVRAIRSGNLELRTAAADSARKVAAHLEGQICPVALARFAALLPITDAESGPRAPDEGTALEYAEVLASVFAWETAVGPDSRLRGLISNGLSAVAQTCKTRIEQHLKVRNEADIPDVRLLARDILRMEAVEWMVGVAGGPAQAASMRRLAHHAARQAVIWAGAVFDRFKVSPTEFSHFDAVATLSAVDDLLVVILRVVEADRDDRSAGSHPFVLTLGEQAMQDFSNGLEHMTDRYLKIAERGLTKSGVEGAFVQSVLSVLRRVLLLGNALLMVVDTLELKLNHDSAVGRIMAMCTRLRTAVARPGASDDLRTRLTVLENVLAEIGAD